MGDKLNTLLIEKYFGYKVKRATPLTCDMSAIGSGLGNFMLSNQIHIRAVQLIAGNIYGDANIWGTGFISNMEDKKFFRKKMNFYALRGELSKQRVEKIIGNEISVVTGDAGLLADRVVKPSKGKKYAVGIIPHFREQDEIIFKKLKEKFPKSIMIDLKMDAVSVIEKITQCEAIISSSLHGLIVADCYGIPNRWVVVSNKPKGDGFKYRDYYSGYGLDIAPLDLNKEDMPTINNIYDDYRVDPIAVNEKKEQLINCFPYK